MGVNFGRSKLSAAGCRGCCGFRGVIRVVLGCQKVVGGLCVSVFGMPYCHTYLEVERDGGAGSKVFGRRPSSVQGLNAASAGRHGGASQPAMPEQGAAVFHSCPLVPGSCL